MESASGTAQAVLDQRVAADTQAGIDGRTQ
jgi:hypothetical protein